MRLAPFTSPRVLLDVSGLTISLIGALISARGAAVEEEDLRKLGRTAGEHNADLEAAMRRQTISARLGFRLIAMGGFLQVLAALIHGDG